jgi:hypothetical protein
MNTMSTIPTVAEPPAQSFSTILPSEDRPRAVPPLVAPINCPAFDSATLKQFGLYTPEEIDKHCAEESGRKFVVQGMLNPGQVGIIVGESGIGKSPLNYQLSLCVAAGIPFVGMKTTQGLVIYVDGENGTQNSQAIRNSIVRHLGIERPKNFLMLDVPDIAHLRPAVHKFKPTLVVIDTLRAFAPGAEGDNPTAATFLKDLKTLGREAGTAFLLIHHPKKPNGDYVPPKLEADNAMEWLYQASGARALINQTDTRIAIEATSKGDAALVMVWNHKVQGTTGPVFLNRVFDEDDEPIGYGRLIGTVDLLNKDQQEPFEKLPSTFSFTEAKHAYNRRGQATADFLKKCIALQLLRKVGKLYRKAPHGTESGGL